MPTTLNNSVSEVNKVTEVSSNRQLSQYCDWLRANGLRTDRFVPVEYENGHKKPTENGWKERQREHHRIDGPAGIVTGDGLAVIDDDSHKDGIEAPGVLDDVPGVRVSTLHAGTHIHIAPDGELPDCKAPEWGDLQAGGDLVVAPGATFHHSECRVECGRTGSDTYTITGIDDGPIDPADYPNVFQREAREARAGDTCEIEPDDVQSSFDGTTAGRLGYAIQRDEKFAQLYFWACGKRSLAGFEYSDRSRAECALAQKLLWWFEHDVGTVRDVLDTIRPPKWDREGPGYRDSVIRYGLAYTAEKGEKYEPERMSGVCRRHALDVSVVLGISDEPVSTANIIDSELVDVEKDQVRKVLNSLDDDGFIHYEKDGRSGGWLINKLPDSDDRFFHRFPTQADVDQQRRNWAVSK